MREILSRLYAGSEIGQGYAGDEDNGETSAWWLFSALGFYPLQMGSRHYAIGSPLFTKVTVHLDNGKKLVVNAPEQRGERLRAGLKVNGRRATTRAYLDHEVLADGATLDFDMGPAPSAWGTGADDAPPSITKGDERAEPAARRDRRRRWRARAPREPTQARCSTTRRARRRPSRGRAVGRVTASRRARSTSRASTRSPRATTTKRIRAAGW